LVLGGGGVLGCLITQGVEPQPKGKASPGPCSSCGTVHAMPPFQLDKEDQGCLEIFVRCDKGQLLAWMCSCQQYWVSAILNSGRSSYIGVTGRKLHIGFAPI